MDNNTNPLLSSHESNDSNASAENTAGHDFSAFEAEQHSHALLLWGGIGVFFGFLFGIATFLFPYFFSEEHARIMTHNGDEHSDQDFSHSYKASLFDDAPPPEK